MLTGAQHALAAPKEARRKAKDEASRVVDERVSLLLELEASKDELIGVREKASKEKKVLDEAFDAGFDVIFNYGYGCCAFAHNICGSEPVILWTCVFHMRPHSMGETLFFMCCWKTI